MAIPDNKPDDSEQREKLIALSQALGLHQMQGDIDSLKDNVGYLRTNMDAMINKFNEFVTSFQSTGQASQPSISTVPQNNPQMEKMQQLSTLLEGIGKAYSAFKGVAAPAASSSFDLKAMGEEFVGLIMKTSMDKLLMSTYDVHVPAPVKYISKVQESNLGHDPA